MRRGSTGSADGMPISHRVDRESRLVVAVGHGTMTDSDVFGYQRDVWSLPEVRGFSELIDMTGVTTIALPSGDRVRDLAELAASMDDSAEGSRFAIVAPADLAFGLGRMFQSYRSVMNNSRKQVGVFRTMEEALAFLGVEGPIRMPEIE